jgi:hypothetical protein
MAPIKKRYISVCLIINRYIVTFQGTVRYRTVSVFMCHLHTWPHHQQTPLPRLSLSGKNKKQKCVFFTIVWPWIITDSLWIKPTDALNSSFVGITTLHVSGSLSVHHREFLALHRYWYILYRFGDRLLPGAGWNWINIRDNVPVTKYVYQ